MIILVLIIITISLSLWSLGSFLAVRNLEQPQYSIVQKEGAFELRQYDSYIVAQVEVKGEYDQALRQGFSLVASYIFGDNSKNVKIPMTSPVLGGEVEPESEKIEMTVPVIDTADSGSRTVSFVMPSKYTLDTLPKPRNPAVTFRQVPSRTVAVLRYTFYTNAARIENKKQELRAILETKNMQSVGTYSSALYNPPLSMPLLLRNEVLVDVGEIPQDHSTVK